MTYLKITKLEKYINSWHTMEVFGMQHGHNTIYLKNGIYLKLFFSVFRLF
jgi:hypothetical protein